MIEDRAIRVFLSSTFADMQREREELVKQVFPQVRRICENRGIGWSYVDLRWGIPEDRIANGELLLLCFAEIEHCRPFFLGILGERYGTVPTVPTSLLEREPWIRNYPDASVTELEIRHGVLNRIEAEQPYTFFYFRSPAENAVEPPTGGRLGLLKQEISSRAYIKPRTYAAAEQLGNLVLDDLTRAIERRSPGAGPIAPDERERLDHLLYAKGRARGYVERPGYSEQLAAHAAGSGPPLVVFGEPGSGKSSLLAWWVLQLLMSPQLPVVYHFVGASPRSAQWRPMLVRIMDELARALEMKEEKAPEDSLELPAVFQSWLVRAVSLGPFVLVVDGLDELDYSARDLELSWLPRHVAPSARLVFSTSSPRILDETSKLGWSSVSLSPLDPAEQRTAISTYLGHHGKHLTEQQEARIISAPQCSNALYLSVLLGELTDQSGPRGLEQAIGRYLTAPGISALLQKVLERLEADYNGPRHHLVRDALTYLCTACRGISESELLDLLGSDGNPLPRAFWSPFRFAIDFLLIEKQGRLYPLHREFQNAVAARYFASEEARKLTSRRLVEYFAHHAQPVRAAEEIPWLLVSVGDFEAAAKQLVKPELLDIIWRQSRTELLLLWRLIEHDSPFTILGAYLPALAGLEHYPAVEALGWLFSHTGHLREAIALRNFETGLHRRTRDDRALSYTLGELSVDAFVYGDLETALAACREHLALARRMEDPMAQQQAHGNLGNILMHVRKYDDALKHYEAQEQICLSIGYTWGLHSATGNQAKLCLLRGDEQRALMLYQLDEMVCRGMGDRLALALCLDNQASVREKYGELNEALRLAQDSEKTLREIGSPEDLQINLALQGSILSKTDLAAALRVFREAEAVLLGSVTQEARSLFYAAMGTSLLQAIERRAAGGLMELHEFSKYTEALSERREYLEAAHRALVQAANLAPNDATVTYLAGIAARRCSYRDEAIRYFERALTLRPGWDEAEIQLGELLIDAQLDRDAGEQGNRMEP
jgi:tetratricopeptide (TPR) repeat protein